MSMCVFVCEQKSWDRVSSLVVLVSIIQSPSLLAFNGPSANVLSGQRGPRAQRHFNGCHDERVKSEQGGSCIIHRKEDGGETERRRGGRRQGHQRGGHMSYLDRYVKRGGIERNRKKQEERRKETGLFGPFACWWLGSIILKMMCWPLSLLDGRASLGSCEGASRGIF